MLARGNEEPHRIERAQSNFAWKKIVGNHKALQSLHTSTNEHPCMLDYSVAARTPLQVYQALRQRVDLGMQSENTPTVVTTTTKSHPL